MDPARYCKMNNHWCPRTYFILNRGTLNLVPRIFVPLTSGRKTRADRYLVYFFLLFILKKTVDNHYMIKTNNT